MKVKKKLLDLIILFICFFQIKCSEKRAPLSLTIVDVHSVTLLPPFGANSLFYQNF